MAKEYAKKFYKSKAWQRCRYSFIQTRISIDGGMCEHCREVPGYIVDHVEEITPNNINDPLITLNHSNLQYLCLVCHNKKTFQKYSPLRDGFKFNGNGDLVEDDTPHV